jgi:hypothetical protein
MSTPSLDHEDPLQGALSEILSAESALHMHPDPIPETTGFLSETDAWAKHAVEHLHAAFELVNRAHRDRGRLEGQIFRLQTRVRELEAASRGSRAPTS